MEDVAEIMMLADRVRETAYAIHVFHGNGHLERIYDNALAHRLRRSGHRVDQQCSLNVFDEDGTLLGSYIADLVINGKLLIELKRFPESFRNTSRRSSATSRRADSNTDSC